MPGSKIQNFRQFFQTPRIAPVKTVSPAPAPTPAQLQPAPYLPTLIQEEIILKRGGKFIVNQGFDETDSQNCLAGATITGLLSVSVPSGSDQSLLITHFANDLSDIAAWGFFTWNMYIDNVPVKSYFGVKSQLGFTSQMRKVGVDILVGGGQTLRIDAVSTAAAAYDVVVSLIGVYGNYDYQKG